jgi:hypothetical protein
LRKTWYEPWLAAALVTAVTGCGVVVAQQAGRAAPIASSPIRIDAVPVPMNSQNPSETAIGDFLYAGGLLLTSSQSKQLHGLSDLEVTGTDRLTAVGDFGILLEARLTFDKGDRLAGLTDARVTPLTDQNGNPLADKANADAEGLALLPNGDRLISFERRHRILVYPANGGPPRPAPMPKASFPPNLGMEALAADPEAGADAYIVGSEISGDTWTCRLSSPCIKGPTVDKPGDFRLVAIKRLGGMRTAYLLRAYDVLRGGRTSLQIFRENTMTARMDIAPPVTEDNFEGLAATPRPDGGVRFYLLTDDNASAAQRTLLLAFDWRPR